MPQYIITPNFRLTSPHFKVVWHKVDKATLLFESQFRGNGRLIYNKGGNMVLMLFYGATLEVFYDSVDWNNRNLQKWLRVCVKDSITDVAKRVLPERLHYWEKQKGISVNCVVVKDLRRNVLGQCNHFSKTISLSPKIIILPTNYSYSVILHEMAHIRYNHHKQSFWNHFSVLLGEDAKQQKLQMDIKMSKAYLYLNYIFKKK